MSLTEQFVVGVDVGTGSVRAGLFDLHGRRQAVASEPIQMWQPKADWAEQSSDDIWNAVGKVVRQVVQDSGTLPEQVAGLGFDATCSLVVLDKESKALTVSESGDNTRNVIVWMDHRAIAETEAINADGHDVLHYVGGRLSPENAQPADMGERRQVPRFGRLFDLSKHRTRRALALHKRL